MSINIIDIFNKRLDASLQNNMKIPFFYFILILSIVVIALFPFYIIKGNRTKALQWIFTSLFLGIMLYLVYVIYITGGFNV